MVITWRLEVGCESEMIESYFLSKSIMVGIKSIFIKYAHIKTNINKTLILFNKYPDEIV